MSKPQARSALYRLIEAGQLTRRALLVPLLDRDLEPGDDALLFLLHDKRGATDAELGAALRLEPHLLEERLTRLSDHGLIARQAIGAEMTPGLALTEHGMRTRDALTANWSELEDALLGELSKKERKLLRKTLGRFVDLLKL